MEIQSGIHSLSAETAPASGIAPPNIYLLVGGTEAVFVDSGYRNEEDSRRYLDYLAAVGAPPVRAIVLTHRHRDHMGGVAHFHKVTHAEVLSSPVEKPFIDTALEKMEEAVRVHRAVEEGETLDLGNLTLEFVHAPGHTLGSMAIYAREPRVLFTGDTVLGLGTTVVTPEDGDMALYLQTLHHFLDYDVALLCPGHGPLVQDSQAKVQGLIEHRLEREEQILLAVREGQGTLEQIFSRLYATLDHRLVSLAYRQIQSHLIKLEREERIRVLREGEYVLAG